MPLQENPNLANKRRSVRHSKSPSITAENIDIISVLKKPSRIPSEITKSLTQPELYGSASESPGRTINDAESSLNMSQVNGIHREHTPQPQDVPRPGRVISATMRSAAFANAEPVTPAETAWSSAIGHASTGKSGRVIEKLQAEIDRLRRENSLIKVQFEEVEKANETLATQNQRLHDRTSNFEASHEASSRQLDRKDRQLQDLREDLRKETEKTARAEERANLAARNEEIWKDTADQAKAIAQQKETEYDAIAACRNMENDRYQGGLDKIRANFSTLMQQREEDVEKHKRLQIVAEQQRKTIQQLEQLTQKLNANFKAYRLEIDSAIMDLRDEAGTNNKAVQSKLQEMEEVTGQMRWIVNVEQVLNHKQSPPRPASKRQDDQKDASAHNQAPPSPAKPGGNGVDVRAKIGWKKLNRNSRS